MRLLGTGQRHERHRSGGYQRVDLTAMPIRSLEGGPGASAHLPGSPQCSVRRVIPGTRKERAKVRYRRSGNGRRLCGLGLARAVGSRRATRPAGAASCPSTLPSARRFPPSWTRASTHESHFQAGRKASPTVRGFEPQIEASHRSGCRDAWNRGPSGSRSVAPDLLPDQVIVRIAEEQRADDEREPAHGDRIVQAGIDVPRTRDDREADEWQ